MPEESKELQNIYAIFRSSLYLLLLLEFVLFVPFPAIWKDSPVWLLQILQKFGEMTIYDNVIYSRITLFLMTCLVAFANTPKKDLAFDPTRQVAMPFFFGLSLTVVSVLVYPLAAGPTVLGVAFSYVVYIIASLAGQVLTHLSLDNISKAFRHGLMRDRLNWENEAFMQEQKKCTDKDAINIPTLFYYKGKMRKGWINIEQPFRGIWVVGVPGSGKTFSIIEPLIRQEAAKGWSLCVYDYKFPTLARKLFYHFEKNKKLEMLPKNASFNVINFVNVEYSRRVNPIQNRYINSVGEASETAVTLMEALQKGKQGGGGAEDFFKKSAENFLAACIFFFVNYDIQHYDKDWNIVHRGTVPDNNGSVKDVWIKENGEISEFYRCKGRYADLPHVLSFLMLDYSTIFEVLMRDEKVASLVAPFQTALDNKAMDQLEGMVGTLRVYVSRLVTPEAFWVLSGDDFDLKISDPQNPSYLLIANDPKMEAIITALNAVILNRLVAEVNTGEGKNNPCSIIVDELPTLYFNKIDRLQGTARSNKVSIALGFQSKEQLEKDYGKEVSAALLNIFGTVVCAASCGKETVEWLSNDIMGKIKQTKESISISRNDTSLSINEELQPLVPSEKIANMPAGWLCGMTARSFRKLEMKKDGTIDVEKSDEFRPSRFYAKTNFDMEEIKEEERQYVELPKFYDFGTEAEKQDFLKSHFQKINQEVKDVCKSILNQTI